MTKCLGVLLLSWQLVACASDSSPTELVAPGPFGPGSVPPPAQGAFSLYITTPAAAGGPCPVARTSSSIPLVDGPDGLRADNYQQNVIDGNEGAVVSCSVSGTSTFAFEGVLEQAGRSFELSNGVLSVDRRGSADITLVDSQLLPTAFLSSTPCTVDAVKSPFNNFQVKPGSMWARFDCAVVEAAPGAACAANGFVVFENCDQ